MLKRNVSNNISLIQKCLKKIRRAVSNSVSYIAKIAESYSQSLYPCPHLYTCLGIIAFTPTNYKSWGGFYLNPKTWFKTILICFGVKSHLFPFKILIKLWFLGLRTGKRKKLWMVDSFLLSWFWTKWLKWAEFWLKSLYADSLTN